MGQGKPRFVVFVNFHDVNIPTAIFPFQLAAPECRVRKRGTQLTPTLWFELAPVHHWINVTDMMLSKRRAHKSVHSM